MKPHEERVVNERKELAEKLAGLDAFLKGPAFKTLDDKAAGLLARQGDVMAEYLGLMDLRIALFKP